MPRFTFENKITLSGAIQIGLLLFAIIGAYFTVVAGVQSAQKDIASLQRQVEPVDDLKTRMAVVERNQVVGRQDRLDFQAQMAAAVEDLRKQNLEILTKLAAIAARLEERERAP